MKVIQMKKLALALSSLAVIGVSAPAFADGGAPFTVNPSAIGVSGYPDNSIVSYSLTGESSELLHLNPDGTTTGQGYFNMTTLNPNSAKKSGLNYDYGLYLVFQLVATGPLGGVQTVTQLNFEVYADPGDNNVYTRAGSTGSGATSAGTEATVSDQGTADILLGFGSLIPGSGVAGPNGGGLAINSTESFSLCSGLNSSTSGGVTGSGTFVTGGTPGTVTCQNADGVNFFVSPNPFYNMAFDAFNNTSQNLTPNADGTVAVTAAGTVDFNVPEPSSIALFGIAAVGLALSARRKQK